MANRTKEPANGQRFLLTSKLNVVKTCPDFKAKWENRWGCLGEAISVHRWTTWFAFSPNRFLTFTFTTCMVLTIQNHVEINHMLQLFEGECVPDFERLKVELLKEEVSSLAPPLTI